MIEINAPEILKSLPARICDVTKPWAERTPDHPALVESSGTWTYQQLETVVEHGGVGAVGVDDGQDLLDVIAEKIAFE